MGTVETLVTEFTKSTKRILFSPFTADEQKEQAYDNLTKRFVDAARLIDRNFGKGED